MSLRVKISHEQMQQGRLIPNGWYSGKIASVDEDTDKSGNNMAVVDTKVTGNPQFIDVPVRAWLCPEWFGGGDFMRRFIEAITNKPYVPDQEVDLAAAIGKDIKFFNKQGTDQNGKPCNQIQDWAHISKTV